MTPRVVAAIGIAGMSALWFAMQDADARRARHRQKHEMPAALPIDIGPKTVRTIRIDPCEVARTFLEHWRCRVP